MKLVGRRLVRGVQEPSDEALKAFVVWNAELVNGLAGGTCYPRKGVRFFKTHAEANAHQDECRARRMRERLRR